eukprot:TRINITY_DN73385_c0_g1_i1.p1 TRINITY_DN73385_c0_g1~~TRINITY_DN73385_c0_g1_i1.p1  ORF type:complete len:648 (-),score=86.59 TRINITY_DN73385_c0_g1_i1:304-2247(-)
MANRQTREIEIQRLSLRFSNEATEKAFVESRGSQLVQTSLRGHYLFVVMALVMLSIFVWEATSGTVELSVSDPDLILDARKIRHMTIVLIVVGLLFDLVFIAALRTARRFFSRINVIECILVGELCVIQMIAPTFSRFSAAKLTGIDPYRLYGENLDFSDSRTMLTWAAFLISGNLLLSIRWIVIVPLEIVTIPVFAAWSYGIGSPEPRNTRNNLLILTFMCTALAAGKRRMEYSERRLFLEAVAERVQRYESEFELSRVRENQRENDESVLVPSAVSSVSSMPISQAIFSMETHELDMHLKAVKVLGHREGWLIDARDIKLEPNRVLGRGSFGAVVAGSFMGTPCAVKVPLMLKHNAFKSLANEARIMRHIKHPNIIAFYGMCVSCGYLLLVEELVVGTDLTKMLTMSPSLRQEQRMRILLDVIRALAYIHDLSPVSVIHGDIKPSNVIVESSSCRRAKLADFGLSRMQKHQHDSRIGGTWRWVAPEVLLSIDRPKDENVTIIRSSDALAQSTDIFSFGRLIFFVTTGEFPFLDLSREQLVESACQGSVPEVSWPSCSSDVQTNLAKRLCDTCTDFDPASRPSALAVLKVLSAAAKNTQQEQLTAAELGVQVSSAEEQLMSDLAAVVDSLKHLDKRPEHTRDVVKL